MHNIKDIVDQVNYCKLSIKKDIDRKLKADKRCTHYLLFIDISKAFDSIDRNKLLKMMADRNFNGLLIKAFEKLFADTRMVINGEKVYTNKGVMQGGVTSPTTFAIYIDNLLKQLNQTSKAFALADDIVCYCEGQLRLDLTIATLNNICKELGLKVNNDKSAIIILRHRNNKKIVNPKKIHGFPVVKQYKYLGIIIDDLLSFKPEMNNRK